MSTCEHLTQKLSYNKIIFQHNSIEAVITLLVVVPPLDYIKNKIEIPNKQRTHDLL